jgi:hypothetical protein
MLANDNAKYSGKGTPMMSRRGKSTISLYACFKQGLTEAEMKATGLKPTMDEKVIEKIKARDKFANAQAKVASRTNNNSRLDEIRERIRQ